MHILSCTISRVLDVPERLSIRHQRHNGHFPFWPEHLDWTSTFEAPADSDAGDVWMLARVALAADGVGGIPTLRQVVVRRLRGQHVIAPGSRLQLVVLGVWYQGLPRFQLLTQADGCPEDFGREPVRTAPFSLVNQ